MNKNNDLDTIMSSFPDQKIRMSANDIWVEIKPLCLACWCADCRCGKTKPKENEE